jgi:RNA polymerase sigma-70 factor, ECF subfamily
MGEFTDSLSSHVGFQETESLVVRLKERDESAFAEVFHLYKDLIYSLSVNMLADKSEAMDITQEVFLTLYRKIHQFRGESSLKTWLYRVAINKIVNRNRWWKRRFLHRTVSLSLNLDGHDRSEMDPVSRRPGPDRQLWAREIQEALQAGLNQLPFEQRAAVTLRDVHELSYEEIAGVTGVQIGTVKSRIARARERLKELLKTYGKGEA